MNVDFPAPELPTMAIKDPAGILKKNSQVSFFAHRIPRDLKYFPQT